MPTPEWFEALRDWRARRRLAAWMRGEHRSKTITSFRGCRFFAGADNKIEAALLRGERAYDQANFTAVTHFVLPGDVCFDIGANIGVYSMVFARLSGSPDRVHAFEPVDHIRDRFLANARLNGFESIHLNALALGAEPGSLDMHQIKEGVFRAGTSTLVRNENLAALGEDAFVTRPVTVTTLDRYVADAALERVDFIKIDVEGFELPVLQGAKETLTRFRPAILFEYDEIRHGDAAQRERLRAIFAERGYRTFEFTAFRDRLGLIPFDFTRQPRNRNLLSVPDGPGA